MWLVGCMAMLKPGLRGYVGWRGVLVSKPCGLVGLLPCWIEGCVG